MSTVIIDYGMGNVASVQKALHYLKIDSLVSRDAEDIARAKYLVLPGVGSYRQGMANINNFGLKDLLSQEVLQNKKPFMGICLGMQLLSTSGSEPESCPGLGWIEGEVIKIREKDRRVPHLGWNNIQATENGMLQDFDEKDFYFIHGYHFQVQNQNQVAAYVNYGNDYVAAIQHENIFATQFHPEKSQQAGLDLLKSFFTKYA